MTDQTREADGLVWSARGSTTDDHLGWSGHEAGFEPLLRSLLPPGGVFLDVGAHVGRWSLRLASQASKVIAIEANPDTFDTLLANVKANNILNVCGVNVAAWDSYRAMRLHDPGYRHAGGSTRVLPDEEGAIQGIPLDDVLQFEDRIDLVKLDVEGADLHALRGMRETLHRTWPVMFIEDHSSLGYYEHEELEAVVSELGYDMRETAERYMSAHYFVARQRLSGITLP